jgi:tetratricopeptide (TPR) repeat protein
LGDVVVLLVKDQPAEALRACDDFLAKQPEHYQATLLRGEICEALNDSENAIAAYRRAVEINPSDGQARFRLNKLLPSTAPLYDPPLYDPPLLSELDETVPIDVDAVSHLQAAAQLPAPLGNEPESSEIAGGQSYRDSVSRETMARPVQIRHVSTAVSNPAKSIFEKLAETIARGQELDRVRNCETLAASRSDTDSGETDLGDKKLANTDADTTLQVIRFDLGMGSGIAAVAQQTRTSGRQSLMTSAAPQTRIRMPQRPVSRRPQAKGFC